MAKTNNIIELNGKFYDVATGAIVPADGITPRHVTQVRRVEVVKRPHLGHHAHTPVDGVSHPSTPRAPKPITAHKPARSTTLMRHAVKQPAVAVKPDFKPQTPLDVAVQKKLQQLPVVAPKMSSSQIHPVRSAHAQDIRRNTAVRRFAMEPTFAHQTRRPVAQSAVKPAVAAAAPQRPNIQRPVINSHSQPERRPGHIQQQHREQQAAAHSSTDIFSQALAHAQSHETHSIKPAKQHGRKHRKLALAGMAAVAVLGLAGVAAYFNKPAIELQLASMKAGFSASLPDYHPEGFSFKSMQSAPGAVTIGYQGPSDKTFNVSQKESNWDSQTLLDNYVATTDESYQAYQANGRTVFIYGKGHATWVNGGVWYQLQGNGISDDEMLKVASTM